MKGGGEIEEGEGKKCKVKKIDIEEVVRLRLISMSGMISEAFTDRNRASLLWFKKFVTESKSLQRNSINCEM